MKSKQNTDLIGVKLKNLHILSEEVQIIQRIGLVGNKFCGRKILFGGKFVERGNWIRSL